MEDKVYKEAQELEAIIKDYFNKLAALTIQKAEELERDSQGGEE